MTPLPDGWSVRRPTLEDLPAILALAHASDIAAVGAPDFTADDVREALTDANTDMSRDVWLALDPAGEIVGWAYPSNPAGGDRDFIEVYVWPGRGEPAQRHLLGLLLARVAERAKELDQDPYYVRAGAIPTEDKYIAALADAGFTFVKQHARMRMSLDGTSAVAPAPPPGVSIRTVDPSSPGEMRRFHAVIAEAFADSDHETPGYDEWVRQIAGEESVSYDEWFVALAADGEIAGVLQSSDSNTAEGEGWVKRLAVLRAYRNKGVGNALLRSALAAYAAKGRTLAGLGVDMANPTRAARLYLAAGMTPMYEANIYQLAL